MPLHGRQSFSLIACWFGRSQNQILYHPFPMPSHKTFQVRSNFVTTCWSNGQRPLSHAKLLSHVWWNHLRFTLKKPEMVPSWTVVSGFKPKWRAPKLTCFANLPHKWCLRFAVGFGMAVFQLQEPHPQSSSKHLTLLPTSTRPFVDAIANRNILAARVTTWYIPLPSEPTANTVKLSLKLWATVIWEGEGTRPI